MIWDKHCNQYLEAMESARKSLPEKDLESWTYWGLDFLIDYCHDLAKSKTEIIPDFTDMSHQEIQWFIDALKDERRKWFALFLIARAEHLPEVLFPVLIKSAVDEHNPSLNEHFVSVASRFGHCRVAAALFDYAEQETDVEREYALSAVYWILTHKSVPCMEEEDPAMLALLKDTALNSKYSDKVRDQARRYYEAQTQQSLEILP